MKKLAIVLVILSLLLSGTIIVGSACGSGTCSACGKYICEGNPQWYLQLNADGTFINVSDGFFKGTWKIDGSTITLKPQGPEWLYGGTTSVGTVQGNTLIHAGVRWVKQVEVHEGGGSTSSHSQTPKPTPKPTVSGDFTVVFPDPNLEAAIRSYIGKPTGQIYKSELQGLTKLWAANSRISDLSGLESCTSLVEVLLDGNQIRDVTPLSKLTNIYALSLINNNISDISPLVGNSGLGKDDFLYLGNNPLSEDSLNVYVPELDQKGVLVSLK